MFIDAFTHLCPPEVHSILSKNPPSDRELAERIASIEALYNVPLRMSQIDQFEDYRQVLSMPNPPLDIEGDQAAALSRLANEGFANLVAQNPSRLAGYLAAVPMAEPEKACREAEYAITKLGANGVQIFTNTLGKALDAPENEEFWSAMEQLDRPVFLHPARQSDSSDYPAEDASAYGLWLALGWPYDTSVAMARLVLSGVMERHPDLKIVVHHLGAMIPMLHHRLNSCSWRDSKLSRPPSEYLKLFYADTALNGNTPAMRCGLEFFGAGHILFASDAPFGPPPGIGFVKNGIGLINSLDLSDEDREAITHRNAEQLLHIR